MTFLAPVRSLGVLAVAAGLSLFSPGCTLLTAEEVGLGVGSTCIVSSDCQGDNAVCNQGVCAVECSQNADCPAPSQCGNGLCQLPLKVGFIYVGVPEDEGWTLTHDLGRQFAESQLPYLETVAVNNTFIPSEAEKRVDEFVAGGAQVIVLNSFSLRSVAQVKSSQYPDVKFLTCSSNEVQPNGGSYFARSYQGWYLAGFAAGRKTKSNRLGFVGSLVTPEVVRHIDAFALGARRANPKAVVEVRWEGFWFDLDPPNAEGKFNETVQAEKLIETGCDVIGHNSDTGRVVEAVEQVAKAQGRTDLFSVGNDNIDGCKRGPSTCLGVPYWNWGPMYVRLFDEIHRNRWVPSVINDSIVADPTQSIVVFGVNDTLVDSSLKIQLGQLLADLVKPDGASLPFRGPYSVSQPDQRPLGASVPDGQSIDDDEMAKMCWFVDNVIMKADHDDPKSADVPARVPDGTVVIGKNADGTDNKPSCSL